MNNPVNTPVVTKVHTLSNGCTLRVTDKEWASIQDPEGRRKEISPRDVVILIIGDRIVQGIKDLPDEEAAA